METSTLNPNYQPGLSSSNSFTVRVCDCASAFGRKVAPLAAGAVIAWLSVTAAPAIGAFCLAAGAVWTGCLVIKPLCSYVISLLFSDPDSEKIKTQLKQQLNIPYDPFINTCKTYSYDNPHLAHTQEQFFSKIISEEIRTKITNGFNTDFTRPMQFEAKSQDGLTFFFKTEAEGLYFQKQQQCKVIDRIKCHHSELSKKPSQPESGGHLFESNELRLKAACHRAFDELSNGNKDLAAAAMDLTTQTVGNAMSVFLANLLSDHYHKNTTVEFNSFTFVDRDICTEFNSSNNGTINAKTDCKVARCRIHVEDKRDQKGYFIYQKLEIKTSMVLDPLHLDQRKFSSVTVEFGKLFGFSEV